MKTDNHLPKDNSSIPGRTNDPETFAKFASVKSYQDYLTDKDNPVVMVTLTVNEQGFLDNTTFETYLTQHTNAHDEFTIVVSDTAIDDFYGQVMRNSKNLLGEPITIHIHHKGTVVQSFKGIIAQVSDALKIQPQHFSYLSYGVEKGEVEEKNTNGNTRNPINRFQLWRWQWETIRKYYLLK